MKPYLVPSRGFSRRTLMHLLVGLVLTCVSAAQNVTTLAQFQSDPLVRSGDEHARDLDYDAAGNDYDRYAKAHPGDPFAINAELRAWLFRELYRLNLLDTTMYARDGFLNSTQPEAADRKTRERINELSELALSIENRRLAARPDDADALYCRAMTHTVLATYTALVDKAFLPALRNALAARRDSDRVLELDHSYTDAKLLVGMHQYIVGSLPLPVKVLVGMTGVSGSKKKGLQLLSEVGASQSASSADARVALALFLRREAQYGEALRVVRSLAAERPRNFLFALEEANLEKDQGNGPAAIAAYRKVLAEQKHFVHPHLELAAYGLGESLRGQRHYAEALQAYDSVGDMKDVQPSVRRRSLLAAGEMYDQLGNREMALKRYRQVLDSASGGHEAILAQKHMHRAFSEAHGG
jgi:hypothetical protein